MDEKRKKMGEYGGEGSMEERRGFTIVELIAVVAIIGGLVAMILPVVTKQIGKAKKGRIEGDVNAIEKGIILHFADTAKYPAPETSGNCTFSGNSITQLIQNYGSFSGWDGPYLDKRNTKFSATEYGVGCTWNLFSCGNPPTPTDLRPIYAQYVVLANVPGGLTTQIDTDLDDGNLTAGRVQVYGTGNTCMVVGTAAQ